MAAVRHLEFSKFSILSRHMRIHVILLLPSKRGVCKGAMGSCPPMAAFVSEEAILSAENSGKPLGGRGSAPNPAGSSQHSPDMGGVTG